MRAKVVRAIVSLCAVVNVIFMLASTAFILFGEGRLLSAFVLAVNLFIFIEARKTLRLMAAAVAASSTP